MSIIVNARVYFVWVGMSDNSTPQRKRFGDSVVSLATQNKMKDNPCQHKTL